MSVIRGKGHNFVGIDVEILEGGKIQLTSKNYIEECIGSFGENLNGHVVTPSADTSFEVDEESTRLSKEKSCLYYHIVAKLLYVTKRR
mmetsp:Transcript_17409/g.24586  ORF Transcript_17409/g.24586 Transcript_17409/m.24586 type:complete len:88 (-) Transcript_17409:582-845(-)